MAHTQGGSSNNEEQDKQPQQPKQPSHSSHSVPRPSHEISDEMLIHAIAGGAEWAIEPLYQRYSRLMYSLAYRMVSNQQIAEDLLQDAFVAVWRRASTYSSQYGTVYNWLTTIIRNRTIDYLRGIRRLNENLKMADWEDAEREEPLADTDTSDEAWQRMQSENLRAALMQLPAEQRLVIELSYYQGWSQSEIAEGTSIPLGTVKARMRLGIKRLKRILEDMGIDER